MLQKLESTDFDEKKEINKRKQLILEGKVNFLFSKVEFSLFYRFYFISNFIFSGVELIYYCKCMLRFLMWY